MGKLIAIANGMGFKAAIFGCWGLSFLVVLFAISQEDRYFSAVGVPIALIKRSDKNVTIRSENDVRWRTVSAKQGLFDGDRVSTGQSSGTVIDFGEGKKGILGPDTIIAISSITQKDSKSFILNLIKGGIKPVVPVNSKSQLIVTSGVNVFYVEPGESKGFTKPVGGSIAQFSGKDKFPIIAKTPREPVSVTKFLLPVALAVSVEKLPTVVLESVPSTSIQPPKDEIVPPRDEVKETPAPPLPVVSKLPAKPIVTKDPPKPKSIIDLAPYLPAIDPTKIPSTLMTSASLKNFEGHILTVKVPSAAKGDSDVNVGLEVTFGQKKEVFRQNKDGTVKIILKKDSLNFATDESLDVIPCVALTIRSHVSYVDDNKTRTGVGSNRQTLRICSLMDAKNHLPISIGLSNLAAGKIDVDAFVPPGIVGSYPIQILLTRETDFIKLIPYVRSATSFKLTKASGLSPTGIFGISNGKSVAQLMNKDISPENADSIMTLLGYSYIYRGSKTASYDASHMDLEAFKTWIDENIDGGKRIFIPVKSSLVAINRDFMSERSEVAEFVKKSSKTLFMEKVEIISYHE